jgi:pantoate--beta-alanine ligase
MIFTMEVLSQPFDFDGLENQMEGKFRPGHFDGVGTVVNVFWDCNSYQRFGEKDFQQLQIVKKWSQNNLEVNVIGCAIYRESNGLAMSSRNERLTDQQREDGL